MTPEDREEVEGAIWQILRKTYVRVMTDGKGGKLNEAQENSLLDKWHPAMEHDTTLIMACVDRASQAGISRVARRIKNAEVVEDDQLEDLLGFDD